MHFIYLQGVITYILKLGICLRSGRYRDLITALPGGAYLTRYKMVERLSNLSKVTCNVHALASIQIVLQLTAVS